MALAIPFLAPIALWVAEFQNRVVEGVASWQYSHFEYTLPAWAMYAIYLLFAVVTLAFVVQKRAKEGERGKRVLYIRYYLLPLRYVDERGTRNTLDRGGAICD